MICHRRQITSDKTTSEAENSVDANDNSSTGKRAPRRRWTAPEEALLRKLHEEGNLPHAVIAQALGRSREAIKSRAHVLKSQEGKAESRNLPYRYGRWTTQEFDQLHRLHSEGKFFADIARILQRSYSAVRRFYYNERPAPRKYRNLTLEDRQEIKASRDAGLGWRQILFDRFSDCSPTSVRMAYMADTGKLVSAAGLGFWTPARTEKLMKWRAEGVSWKRITEQLHTTTAAAQMKWTRVTGGLGRTKTPWTEAEVEELRRLKAEDMLLKEIASVMMKPLKSVISKCEYLKIHDKLEKERKGKV